eukprot:7385079-Prymnesium_polylepis.2
MATTPGPGQGSNRRVRGGDDLRGVLTPVQTLEPLPWPTGRQADSADRADRPTGGRQPSDSADIYHCPLRQRCPTLCHPTECRQSARQCPTVPDSARQSRQSRQSRQPGLNQQSDMGQN